MLGKALSLAAAGNVSAGNPWDISALTFSSNQLAIKNISAQDTNPFGVFFKPDGTKMYTVGDTNNLVYEYDLSTAWDITTATYLQSFSVAAYQDLPRELFFSPDGVYMFVLGDANVDSVIRYNLSTAWDITTAVYSQQSSLNPQNASPRGLYFRSDGLRMYYLGGANPDSVYEYTLSVAWNLGGLNYRRTFAINTQDTAPGQVFFKPDGTKMYVSGDANRKVYEYSLSTAWLVTSATFVTDFAFAPATSGDGMFFHPDGDRFYILSASQDMVFEYSLSTPWDLSTASFVYPSTDYLTVGSTYKPYGVFFKPDGTEMYIAGGTSSIFEYHLSTAWDITTATFFKTLNVSTQDLSPKGVFFKEDGSKMQMLGGFGRTVDQYNIQAGQYWNIEYASSNGDVSVSGEESTPEGFFIDPTGKKMYVTGTAGDDINEYNIAFGSWDVRYMNYVRNFSVSSQDTAPSDVFFKDDGTKMYVLGRDTQRIYEYDLSTAWNISSASYLQSSDSIASLAPEPQGMFFKPDGTKVYVVDSLLNAVVSFDL